MYCDRCGSSLPAGSQFCANCGKAVQPSGMPAAPANYAPGAAPDPYDGRVQRHVQILALLWAINGILRLLEVASFYVIGRMFLPWVGIGFDGHFPWGFGAWPMFGLWWAAVFLGGFGVVHLVLAWSLYERKPWARLLGLIVGFLALLRFPLGTALGIYTIWVLLPESSAREYERLAHA